MTAIAGSLCLTQKIWWLISRLTFGCGKLSENAFFWNAWKFSAICIFLRYPNRSYGIYSGQDDASNDTNHSKWTFDVIMIYSYIIFMYNFFFTQFWLFLVFLSALHSIVARTNHGVERDKILDINKLDWISIIRICIENLSQALNIFNHISTAHSFELANTLSTILNVRSLFMNHDMPRLLKG